ncbi:plant/F14N23-31 protein [Senna tora]|uniref:Plant/F14N23-31 protein n=1 Tax=Senna tora TaxID=362788 RepID=A0A834WZE5_9FABA|nr:plant/F14N23-31 protein [Senna tora]
MFSEEECLLGYLRDHLIRSLLRNSFWLLFLHQYAFHKSIEEAWFDSVVIFDYDCDDDFYSVPNDVLSLNGIEGGKRLSSSTKKQSCKGRIDGYRRKVSCRISKGSLDRKPVILGVPDCSSFTNLTFHRSVPNFSSFATPTFHGSFEEAWFDSVGVFDSDRDDDYQSVLDDFVSPNGIEVRLIPNFPIKDANHEKLLLLSKNI